MSTVSRSLQTAPARCPEYVYICASAQMPQEVRKIGETHRQTPQERARQFTGADRKVRWTVERAFETPDSKATERLVHDALKARGLLYEVDSELFVITTEEAAALIERCVALTPVPPRRQVQIRCDVALPLDDAPGWALALTLPVTYVDEPGMTLARALALAAQGVHALRKRLTEAGIELVYPDAQQPDFRIHALPGGKLAEWLRIQGLSWASLGIAPGDSRKVRFCVDARH